MPLAILVGVVVAGYAWRRASRSGPGHGRRLAFAVAVVATCVALAGVGIILWGAGVLPGVQRS